MIYCVWPILSSLRTPYRCQVNSRYEELIGTISPFFSAKRRRSKSYALALCLFHFFDPCRVRAHEGVFRIHPSSKRRLIWSCSTLLDTFSSPTLVCSTCHQRFSTYCFLETFFCVILLKASIPALPAGLAPACPCWEASKFDLGATV